MKNYEVHTYKGFRTKLRYETDRLYEAVVKAREIEKTSTEDFEGTAIYANRAEKWLNRHERGTK